MTNWLRWQVLLPVLIAVLGGGAYLLGPAKDVAPASRPAQAANTRNAQSEAPVADVRLELLNASAAEPVRPTRNPFRFQPRPAPAARRVQTPTFIAPPAPTGPPPLPAIPLRFIGLIEAPPRTGRVALLSDGRGGLMYGREGDTVEGRYRMLRVGTDSIEMAYADGRGRQTIRLSGQ